MPEWRRLWRRESYNRASLTRQLKRSVRWARRKLPPGARLVAGIVLVICGCFGFLPILGFWMLPLGLVLIGLDIPPVHRRLVAWSEGGEAE